MHKEDNNGFINFPLNDNFDRKRGKTYIYLISFDNDNNYDLSNISINLDGDQVADDISADWFNLNGEQEGRNNFNDLITSICIGWYEGIYVNWFATFKNLTFEGRKLYYSIKKLHNNKEVRILTIIKK
jgi:hypothetical protein